MMRKMLLAAALSVTAMTAHADYQCSVTPRDDVIVSPQTVQVKGENGNLCLRRIRHGKRVLCYQSGASKCWPDFFLREDYDAQNAAGGSTFSDGNDRSRRLPVQRHAA
ncbi:hypothetical protein GUI26_27815 [Escherichia coli]|nr:hypothetical protein [Escherichia coli]